MNAAPADSAGAPADAQTADVRVADVHVADVQIASVQIADVQIYDTTLRDGSQREGLSLSVADKLAVARHLDDLGVGYIEGGWPGSNPKDTEFFRRARTELDLQHAVLAAFGATRKAGAVAADDPQVAALREADTPVVTLVAKSHADHVTRALRTTPRENLAMVADTVGHLVAEGKRVFVDAEHFFDGYRADRDYGVEMVRTAVEAGAEVVALCDTNGGMLPHQVADVVAEVADRLSVGQAGGAPVRLGIHAHDDTACAVANSLSALIAGARHVQGCINGYGERCGNADIGAVVAALEVKLGAAMLPPGRLGELSRVSHAVAELANISPDPHQAWTGSSAFAHKAGLHVSAIKIDPDLYQHTDPTVVGNDMRLLVSELAGRATIELKGVELGVDLSDDRETVTRVIERVKGLESAGWSFEAADASFELLLREETGTAGPRPFELESWRVIVERRIDGVVVTEATVKLMVGGRRVVSVGEGNGPVNALDMAMREALAQAYPDLARFDLVDYKVRIVSGSHGSGAVTRVLIDTTDGSRTWSTVGVDENVISASWRALEDAYRYGLTDRS